MSGAEKHSIVLLGPNNLGNQMLIYSIEQKLNFNSLIYEEPLGRFPADSGFEPEFLAVSKGKILFLIDCKDADIDEITGELLDNETLSNHLIAFYNLSSYSESEVKALTKRVRGFFYVDDSMELFLKGVKSIFQGEVWISRQILLRYIMNRAEEGSDKEQHSARLTQREQQILSLMSAGVDNEEIGDKLCISVNTVKTHMYNIYKKINVSNRLQAALWAARNL